MDELFETIRESLLPEAWSKAVSLARNGKLDLQRAGDEVTVFVKQPGTNVARVVNLWPEDVDWKCDCGSPDDPCFHVAAAVIAAKHQKEEGRGGRPAAVKVGYYFFDEGYDLSFVRKFMGGAYNLVDLSKSLSGIVNGRIEGPDVVASKEDLACDIILDTYSKHTPPQRTIRKLFSELRGHERVFLDGKKIKIWTEQRGHLLRLERLGGEIRLKLSQDLRIEKVFRNGACICKDGLFLTPVSKLSADEAEYLESSPKFGTKDIHYLTSEILPKFRTKIAIDRASIELPEATKFDLSLHVQSKMKNGTISVYTFLTYGYPAIARVTNSKLECLHSGIVPVRNKEMEVQLRDKLNRQMGLTLNEEFELNGDQALNFISDLENLKIPFQIEHPLHFKSLGKVTPRLSWESGLPSLEFTNFGSASSRAELSEQHFMNAWNSEANYVSLTTGGWAQMPGKWMDEHKDILLTLLQAKKDYGAIPKCLQLEAAEFCSKIGIPAPESFTELRNSIERLSIKDCGLPDDLTADLRAYQKEGFRWLSGLKNLGLGALLADDMGLGKTLQALSIVDTETLVVAPYSVIYSWKDQAKLFRPSLRINLYHGPGRKLNSDTDLTITTYGTLRSDASLLHDKEWNLVIFDEAQALKNPKSKGYLASRKLKALSKIAMTGTPVENNLEDLWSQFSIINPGLLGSQKSFFEHYVNPISKGYNGQLSQLKKRIRPFILRRKKDQVAKDLPERTVSLLYSTLSPEEKTIYDALLQTTRHEVKEMLEKNESVFSILERLLRLRQIACHPGLVPSLNYKGPSAKLELLTEKISEVISAGHKSLVFSQWTGFLDLISDEFDVNNIPFLRLDGKTKNRGELVESFQKKEGPPVFLISLKAGGVGLTLTEADHVFIMDPWWNPAAEEQAADRAHRIGQTKPVLVNKLITTGTLEEKILDLQKRKSSLSQSVLSESSVVKNLSKEDLLELLQ